MSPLTPLPALPGHGQNNFFRQVALHGTWKNPIDWVRDTGGPSEWTSTNLFRSSSPSSAKVKVEVKVGEGGVKTFTRGLHPGTGRERFRGVYK